MTARQIHCRHAGGLQAADQFDRLGEIEFQWPVWIRAEAELIGEQMLILQRFADFAAGFVRQHVEHAEANHDHQIGKLLANAADDGEHQPAAAVQIAAEPAGARAGTEELVQQIAVAGFYVDELITDVAGQSGGGDEGVDQALEIVVGPDDCVVVGIDAEFGVEKRMMVGDARFEAFIVRAGKSAGMRELQADEQIVVAAEGFAVRLAAGIEQGGQAGAI